MITEMPEWLANVPLKTVGVLCAVNIFGKNIESRQIALAGKRYFHNAVENVINYALNPMLPPLDNVKLGEGASCDEETAVALENVCDCFNYIFHIQIEYFRLLYRVRPERFIVKKSGRELNLNQFAGRSPTLINSEKRYLILSKIDGAQPYDLAMDWNADFVWPDAAARQLFHKRLATAQDAYADTLELGEWYRNRDRNLIIPLKTILDDLSVYFSFLGQAAYLMARKRDKDQPGTLAAINDNLAMATRHLEHFILDMGRMNIFTIVKHDLDRLDQNSVSAVIKARAEEETRARGENFDRKNSDHLEILDELYRSIGFNSTVIGKYANN